MNDKKDKILFWIESFQIHFGIAKALIEKYDCESYGLLVSSLKQKSFFDNQKLIKFKKSWYLRDNVDLLWGLFTRFDPSLDIHFEKFEKKSSSIRFEGRMIVDATFKYWYPKLITMDDKVSTLVNDRWKNY